MTDEEIIESNNPRVGGFYKLKSDYAGPSLIALMSIRLDYSMIYKVCRFDEENNTVSVENRIIEGVIPKDDFLKMFTSLKVLNYERDKKNNSS